MRVTVTDEARRYAKRFGELTGVTPIDALVVNGDASGETLAVTNANTGTDTDTNTGATSDSGAEAGESAVDVSDDTAETRLVLVVPAGRKGEAVGPQGTTVERAEAVLGVRIDLVEHAESAAAFVANALAPAAVRDVTVSQMGVAFAEVLDRDRGVAIGRNGENIAVARRLARRHFELDDVQLA